MFAYKVRHWLWHFMITEVKTSSCELYSQPIICRRVYTHSLILSCKWFESKGRIKLLYTHHFIQTHRHNSWLPQIRVQMTFISLALHKLWCTWRSFIRPLILNHTYIFSAIQLFWVFFQLSALIYCPIISKLMWRHKANSSTAYF